MPNTIIKAVKSLSINASVVTLHKTQDYLVEYEVAGCQAKSL